MIKHLYSSRKIIISTIILLPFFIDNSKAQTIKNYSVLEPMSENTLVSKVLQNNEKYIDIQNCFNEAEVTRRPDIITDLDKQSICFNKYAVNGELRTKLLNTDKSIERLNLYKTITETALNKVLEIDNDIKSNSPYKKIIFSIIPKGSLVEAKIQKETHHKAQCKINNLDNSKTPVQSGESKEVSFSIFAENTREQVVKLEDSFSYFQKVIDESKGGSLGTITKIGLNLKINSLLNDLTLFNTEYLNMVNTELSSTNNTVAFIEINFSENNQYDSKNPSKTILDVTITYPRLDSNLTIIGRENVYLPPIYLETFENEILPKIISTLKKRISEYDNLTENFSKNKINLTTSISTIEKDLSCYNVDNPDKSINSNIIQELSIHPDIDKIEKQTIITFISDIWNKTVLGVRSNITSASDKTKQLITINPSPIPTPGVYRIVSSSTKTIANTSPTILYPKPSPTLTNAKPPIIQTTYKPSPTPLYSYLPRPTNPAYSPTPRVSATPTPTPTPTYYYPPIPTIQIEPTPTPTPSYSPVSSPDTPPAIPEIIIPTPSTTPTSNI